MNLLSLIPLPEPVAALFHDTVEFTAETPGDAATLISATCPEVILCSTGGLFFDRAVIEALPASVRAIATYSVGHDHLDLAAAAARNIAVFNTPDVLADSVADVAMLLILGAARRATESIALIRDRRWSGWTPTQLLGVELRGKRLGILGMGGIGGRIARRAQAFGMTLSYTNRRPVPDAGGAQFVPDAAELLAGSDVFVLACPSTPETRGFINARTLALVKPSLILVNVGRGDLIVDEALTAALRENRVQAAGLDVFAGEPQFDPRYLELPNVFMLPHIGSSTIEARLAMGQALIDGLLAWRRGERPSNRLV